MASERQVFPALIWEGAERVRIPPGEYTARCTGFQGWQWIREFGRWGLRVEFQIDPDEQPVSAFYSGGEDKNAPRIGSRSKFLKDWVRANGGPPERGQEMSAASFLNPALGFVVRVSDSTTDAENTVKDAALVYSRIDKIIEIKRPSTQEDMQPSW